MNANSWTVMSRIQTWPYRNIIPDGITFLGCLLTFQALIFINEGNFVSAGWFIQFAAVLDLFDGPAARMVRSSNSMGKLFDAFADLINHGVVAPLLVYMAFLKPLGALGILLSFCLLMFNIIRLARFTTSTAHKADYFTGLPVSLPGTLAATGVIFCDEVLGYYPPPLLVAGLIPPLCWLMVSNLRFPKSYFLAPERVFHSWLGLAALALLLMVVLYPAWLFIQPLVFTVGMITIQLVERLFHFPNVHASRT